LKGGRRRRRQQERAALAAAGAGDGGKVSDKQVSIKYQQVSGFILFIFIAVFSRYLADTVSVAYRRIGYRYEGSIGVT
jgi:hypothetical protein